MRATFARAGRNANGARPGCAEVRKIEERDDEPPEEELDVRVKTDRRLAQIKIGIDRVRRRA
jgi:hypothetical protein